MNKSKRESESNILHDEYVFCYDRVIMGKGVKKHQQDTTEIERMVDSHYLHITQRYSLRTFRCLFLILSAPASLTYVDSIKGCY
jgi:hypothetical protein